MERLDVIRSHADVQDPPPYAAEEGDGGFVDACDVFGADEHIAEQHQGNDSNGHLLFVLSVMNVHYLLLYQ